MGIRSWHRILNEVTRWLSFEEGASSHLKMWVFETLLLASGSIAAVAEPPSISVSGLEIEIIEASGKTVIPGFVDNHVHIVMMDAMDATLRNASF